jgi:S-adenosylmethionine uptake transporter
MISAYRSAPAAIVAPFQYSQMLWAVLYGFLWFDETPDRYVLLGTGVIIIAGLMIVWRESSVSVNQPFLQTRTVRVVSAPPMQSTETEEPSPDQPADQPSE